MEMPAIKKQVYKVVTGLCFQAGKSHRLKVKKVIDWLVRPLTHSRLRFHSIFFPRGKIWMGHFQGPGKQG